MHPANPSSWDLHSVTTGINKIFVNIVDSVYPWREYDCYKPVTKSSSNRINALDSEFSNCPEVFMASNKRLPIMIAPQWLTER